MYSLLSMLGTHDKDDMSRTLLAMSSSQDSCIAMRQSGCLPLLIQLLHGNDKDSLLLGGCASVPLLHTSPVATPSTSYLAVSPLQVTPAAAKRRGRGRRRHCTTSSTVSRTTSEDGARSECSTCWSRCATIVRPAGAGKRTTRGASTRRTIPVSVRHSVLISHHLQKNQLFVGVFTETDKLVRLFERFIRPLKFLWPVFIAMFSLHNCRGHGNTTTDIASAEE